VSDGAAGFSGSAAWVDVARVLTGSDRLVAAGLRSVGRRQDVWLAGFSLGLLAVDPGTGSAGSLARTRPS
jgi:hypothetical protein